MTLSNLVPWRHKKHIPVRKEEQPVFALQNAVNDLFDRFFDQSPMIPSFGDFQMQKDSFVPKVDIRDTDKDIQVSAEVPGLDEKGIDISLSKDTLTIKGEKKSEFEDKKDGYHRIERSYGSFCRTIALPYEVEQDKVEAHYKHGILKVILPKTAKALKSRKKIEVNVT